MHIPTRMRTAAPLGPPETEPMTGHPTLTIDLDVVADLEDDRVRERAGGESCDAARHVRSCLWRATDARTSLLRALHEDCAQTWAFEMGVLSSVAQLSILSLIHI